ncbi:MAG: LAGLIDADG family homing endonuclease, partial [Candidatus Aenigmatarchaeota archaeon]
PSNLKIMSFSGDEMKVKPLEVEQFWKIKSPEKLVRIKTQLGKEIKTTPENPIPVFEDGEIKWIKAEELTGEEHLITPRNLDSANSDFEKDENISIYEFLDKTSRLQNSSEIIDGFASKIKANGGIREFCNETDIGEDSLYYAWRNNERRGAPMLSDLEKISNYLDVNLVDKLPQRLKLSQRNGHEIDLPKYINEDLMYFIGLLAGDGDLYHTQGGGIGLRFCNSNEELLSAFSEIAQDMGTDPYLSNEKDKTPYLRFGSKIIGKIASQFGMPIGEKRNRLKVTEKITRLPERYIASYLRGLFDTDGYVNKRRNNSGSCSIGLSSSSEEFIRQIQMLLLRFGIRSKLRRREPSESIIRGERIQSNEKYLLTISQKENMVKFKREIGFDSSEKKEGLNEVLENITEYHSNVDLVPDVGKLIREAREELDISARELYGSKNYSYEKGRMRPSRKKFEEIVNKLKEFGYEGILENIASSDIFFEGIEEVERVDAEDEWVYDLTVRGEHSFVTNGMVVHNTASVVRDEEFMGGWVLEAGALVLSNKSLIAIDEFDKMSKEDQVNLHEAMSTQTISISKASIQATLPARTSVIGGANPKLSRFDPYRPINEQIDIPQTILSRFDIRFTLRDVPDRDEDEKLVNHIIEGRVGEEGIEPVIDPDFLKKYVAYARETCYPEMTEKAASILKNFYVNMRNKYTEDDSNSVPLSLRQYEALLRLSEASAKIKLKDEVSKKDAQRAIRLMKESLKQLGMDPETGNIDIDRAEGGTPGSQRSKIRVVMDLMDELEDEMGKNIPIEDLVAALEEEGLSNADKIIREMKQKGMIFEPRPGHIQKI